MEKEVNISVVVTVFNLEKYIAECLDSILCQDGISFEIICVDDQSTDASCDIIEKYVRSDPRVKLIRNQRNMGISSSRNIGFRVSVGEYLYTIDGDDKLCIGALNEMYSCAKRNSLDLLAFSAKSFFEAEELRKYGEENEYVRSGVYPDVLPGAELFRRLVENNDRVGCNMVMYLFRQDFFVKNQLYGIEGLQYADDSTFPAFMAAKRAMCIPDQLYLRRYRVGSQVTSPIRKKHLESMVRLYCEELQLWKNTKLSREQDLAVETYFDKRLREIEKYEKKFYDSDEPLEYLPEDKFSYYIYKKFIQRTPFLISCFDDQQSYLIKNTKNIVLYGAGTIAQQIAEVLEYWGIYGYQVAITNNGGCKTYFHGKEVYNIHEIEDKQALIIVAASEKNQGEMCNLLDDLSFENRIVMPWM